MFKPPAVPLVHRFWFRSDKREAVHVYFSELTSYPACPAFRRPCHRRQVPPVPG